MMTAERIVSFTPSTTDILKLLGLDGRIVGADSLSVARLYNPDVEDLGPIDAINAHLLGDLKPDMVIVTETVAGVEGALSMLDENAYQVVTLHSERFDDLLADIYAIGVECGVEEKAREAIDTLTQRIKRLTGLVNRAGEPLRAYFEWYPNPFVTAGNQSWVADMLKKAGAINIFQDTYHPTFVIDDEQEIISRDPQVIFICWRGAGDDDDIEPEIILNRKNWGTVSAIKTKQVYFLPESLFAYPGPQLVAALEMLIDLVARAGAEE
jgi:ABC-type Fe3+-hydroxamate transport system substrate-binding protein